MHFRFSSKMTIAFLILIVFSSSISSLSVRHAVFAKPSNSAQSSRSKITARTNPLCTSGTYHVYHAGAQEFFTADGATGNFTQDMPALGPNEFHSLAELAVESPDGKQVVEVGWNVDACIYQDNSPHLFVFYWVDGVQKCYNEMCSGFMEVANTLHIKPGDKVSVDTQPSVTQQYEIEQMNNEWQIWYQNVEIGYYPDNLWPSGFNKVGLVQWFGEVSTPPSQLYPCSQMGNGVSGSTQGSAVINAMQFIVGGQPVRASAQQVLDAPASYYAVGNFQGNSLTYGGAGDTTDCPQTSADWPMSNYDPAGTRANVNEHTLSTSNVAALVKGWSVLGGGDTNDPVVANGAVYIGGTDGKLYAFNARTGNPIWSSDPIGESNGIFSDPAVTSTTVYVGSSDGDLYALDVSTGKTLWIFQTGGPIDSSPTVLNNTVYFGSSDKNLYAVNASSGAFIWNYPSGGAVGTPAVTSTAIYFSSADFSLHAVIASTGKDLWPPIFYYCAPVSPVVVNTVVYEATACGDLYSIDAGSGTVNWTEHTEASPTTLAVTNKVIYVGWTSGNNAFVYAFDATKQAPPLWETLTDGLEFTGSPTVTNGVVYIGADFGSLYALDARTGNILWKYAYGNIFFSAAIVANGLVYVAAFGGYLDAFQLPS